MMNSIGASASSSKRQKRSSSIVSQQSDNEESTATSNKNVLKMMGRPRESDVAHSPVGKEVQNKWALMNQASAISTRSWTRSGVSTKVTASYVKKPDSAEESGPEEESGSEEQSNAEDQQASEEDSSSEEERHAKRQKKDDGPKVDTKSSSSSHIAEILMQSAKRPDTKRPDTKRPDTKRPKASISLPKTVTPKAKKIKPPKGVRISAKYSSDPAAVFIQPLEVTNGFTEGYTRDGEGKEVYHGEPNLKDDLLEWKLNPRLVYRGPSHPKEYITTPPILTLKKWRAYCAFRNLDTTGTREDMQNRLRDWFQQSRVGVVAESLDMTPHLEVPVGDDAAFVEWKERNENERAKLWNLLSIEEKLDKDLLKILKQTVLQAHGKPTYKFNHIPQLSINGWKKVEETLSLTEIGFIFTTFPQSPSSAPVNTRYLRGRIEGASWLVQNEQATTDFTDCKFLGGTWAGSGFEEGIIFGKTRALVKQKVEEICERVERDIIRSYIEKSRAQMMKRTGITVQQISPPPSDDIVSQNEERNDWNKEEEQIAQAAWKRDEAKKSSWRPSSYNRYTYRLGKLYKRQNEDNDYDTHTDTEEDGWEG